MGLRLLVACGVLGLLFEGSARAESDSDLSGVDFAALNKAYKSLQAHKGSLEKLYTLALDVQTGEGGVGRPTPPMPDVRKLVRTGTSAHGVQLAMPDLAGFEVVARKYGTASDAEFFRLLHRTYPDSQTAAYFTLTSDNSHCTNFARGIFVPLYGDWGKFHAAHSSAYAGIVSHEITAMEHELSSAKCSCTSLKITKTALMAFVKAYPRGDVTPYVEGRLDQLRRRRTDFHFDCTGLDPDRIRLQTHECAPCGLLDGRGHQRKRHQDLIQLRSVQVIEARYSRVDLSSELGRARPRRARPAVARCRPRWRRLLRCRIPGRGIGSCFK